MKLSQIVKLAKGYKLKNTAESVFFCVLLGRMFRESSNDELVNELQNSLSEKIEKDKVEEVMASIITSIEGNDEFRR